ncbi:MAG: 2-amino-4-hydroxy-6-hydroxymethyldihydropteridine diphosphokinase [Bacteroidota bacterium]
MKEVFILIGSNRGDRMDNMRQALQMISLHAGTVLNKSAIYETEPWGFEDSISFLNQVVEIETSLQPEALLEQLLNIESKLGRIRPFSACSCNFKVQISGAGQPDSGSDHSESKYTGRTIDLDILFYEKRLVFTDNLMIPHPRLHERRFAMVPLNEIAPGLDHPLLKKTISLLLKECRDQSKVTEMK